MYRLFFKEDLMEEKTQSTVESLRDVKFRDFVAFLFKEKAFIVFDKYCSPATDIQIDFTTGDIYFPIQVGKVERLDLGDYAHNLPNDMITYAYNHPYGLVKVDKVKTINYFIFKKGELVEPRVEFLLTESNKSVFYDLQGIKFEELLSPEDIIYSLWVRDTSTIRTRIPKFKGIRISKKFLELQSLLDNDNVFLNKGKYRSYKPAVPKMERHICQRYEDSNIEKKLAEQLFNLDIYSIISNKIDVDLHDGSKLKEELGTNKFFFKIKTEMYYLILKREWFEWIEDKTKGSIRSF